MTDNNKATATEVALNDRGLENGKDLNQLLDDNGAFNRQFGVVDLWRMRRNARKFKIHNRIPRL